MYSHSHMCHVRGADLEPFELFWASHRSLPCHGDLIRSRDPQLSWIQCMTSAWLSNTECFPLALKISNTHHSMMTNAVGAGIKFESSLLAVVSCGMGSSPRIFSRHGLRTGNGWKDAVQALSFLLEPLRHTWCWTFTFVIICRCRGGKHWLKSVTNRFHMIPRRHSHLAPGRPVKQVLEISGGCVIHVIICYNEGT